VHHDTRGLSHWDVMKNARKQQSDDRFAMGDGDLPRRRPSLRSRVVTDNACALTLRLLP
jgi:hypothetical protein